MRIIAIVVLLTAVAAPSFATIVGPDGFGYYGDDGFATFEWIEISGTGIATGLGDDANLFLPGLLTGMGFTFYGGVKDDLNIQSNGTLCFVDGYIGLGNGPIPDDQGYATNEFIAPFWDDLNPTNGEVYYQVFADKVVVQWDAPHYGGTGNFLFEAILWGDSEHITFQYMEVDSADTYAFGASATVGIQHDPTLGLQWSYNQPVIYNGQRIDWYIPEPGTTALFGGVALGALAFLRRRFGK